MAFRLTNAFNSLISSLPAHPIDQAVLHDLVSKTLDDTKHIGTPDSRKAQWEFMLKEMILDMAATEGEALKGDSGAYYTALYDRLDVCLVFEELEACARDLPFSVLEDLLETQTIPSCSRIFSWLELRSKRLTKHMVSQKGKSLVLLRTLNELLKRLSKMGSTTLFCGRILTFLSDVFPLGERSAVNLRGEYGSRWDGPGTESTAEEPRKEAEEQQDAMQVDESAKKEKAFYDVFWSLQYPFSYPPAIAVPGTFAEFQASVSKVLPVIKEATSKERAMMGSRASAGGPGSLKRKRDPEIPTSEGNSNEYFFAKFLTSPDLLDLEIADTHFRRQLVFQLLILLHHLLNFTKAAKETWVSPRNRSLQLDFVLEPPEAQWVQETISKAMDELRATTPSGRAFADTVNTILERDKNWVKWKNDMCPPFDKPPWFAEVDGKKIGLEEATREVRRKMREPVEPWPHHCGSSSLSDVWMQYRDLGDLQNPFDPGDVKNFVKQVKGLDMRINNRRKLLERQRAAAPPKPTPAEASPAPTPKPELPSTPAPAPSQATPTSPPQSLPRPASASILGSPLHPSLPAKPGTVPPPQAASPAPPPKVELPPVAAPTATSASSSSIPSLAPPPPPAMLTDTQIEAWEDAKQVHSWLALRVARENHLAHFGKIGTGDILLLAEEIEKESQAVQERKEKALANRETATPGLSMDSSQDEREHKLEAGFALAESSTPAALSLSSSVGSVTGDSQMAVDS